MVDCLFEKAPLTPCTANQLKLYNTLEAVIIMYNNWRETLIVTFITHKQRNTNNRRIATVQPTMFTVETRKHTWL